jgi:hypothetical protein
MTTDWAWERASNYNRRTKEEGLPFNIRQLLTYVRGNGPELLMLIQKEKDSEARRATYSRRLKKAASLCGLLVSSAAMITMLWAYPAREWMDHWFIIILYVWSCCSARETFT